MFCNPDVLVNSVDSIKVVLKMPTVPKFLNKMLKVQPKNVELSEVKKPVNVL